MALRRGKEESCDKLLLIYLQEAHALILKCQQFHHINGMQKLEKNCRAELKYLQSLSKRTDGVRESQLKSSNLCHFAGILHAMQVIPDVVCLMKAIHSPNRTNSRHIDIVAGQGQVWVKVIARKAQALHLIWAGEGQFGEHDLFKQAEDYIVYAKSNPVNFCTPTVHFAFYSQVTSPMAEALELLEIKVWGERVAVDPDIKIKLQAIMDEESDDFTDEESKALFSDNDTRANTMAAATRSSVSLNGLPMTERELPLPFKELSVSHEKLPLPNGGLFMSDNDYALCNAENRYCTSTTQKVFDSASLNRNCVSQPGCTNICNSDFTKVTKKLEKPSLNKGHTDLLLTGPSCSTIYPNESSKHLNLISNTSEQGLEQSFSDATQQQPNPSCCHIHSEGSKGTADDLFISCLLISVPKYDISTMMVTTERSNANHSEQIGKVNLDITTLITMVSAVTHGGCHFAFPEKILTLQAKDERENPALPALQQFLHGKEWYACQTAWDDFETILQNLGGPEEKRRARLLLHQLKVIPDQPSKRAQDLPNTGKMRQRTKVIFGTGDTLGAVTTTANMGFVRAAEHQGVSFAVYRHSSRALTEEKEKNATPLDGIHDNVPSSVDKC